jgi:hypothetical protein
MENIINRTVVLTLKLSEVAKDFGYKLEADSYDDVYHNGYSNKDIRNQSLNLPENMDDLNKYFPAVVAQALEDAERSAIADGIVKYQIRALEECLLKIDLTGGGAEYQEPDGNFVSAKAGITNVEIDEANDSILVTILNPEHLINTVINGVGYIYPDLSSTEPASNEELIKRFHNLKDYFDVYGERKPEGELPSQYSPDIDDDMFEEELKFRLSELTLEDVAQAVLDYIKSTGDEVDCAEFSKFPINFSTEEIRNAASSLNNEEKENIENKIK